MVEVEARKMVVKSKSGSDREEKGLAKSARKREGKVSVFAHKMTLPFTRAF
jgi:hypothetical protein